MGLKDKFNLKDKVKSCAVFAKDAAINTGDAVISGLRAYNNNQQGNFAGAKREMDDLLANIDARKAARHANKPA